MELSEIKYPQDWIEALQISKRTYQIALEEGISSTSVRSRGLDPAYVINPDCKLCLVADKEYYESESNEYRACNCCLFLIFIKGPCSISTYDSDDPEVINGRIDQIDEWIIKIQKQFNL